jgi:CRISPR-associated protein (TIGR02584 family)
VTKTHAQDVVLFAPMGSNPALLVAMVWALERQHGLRVAEAYAVLADKGERYVGTELLPPGKGLDELHEVMGTDSLPREHLYLRTATLPDGTPVKDELSDGDAEAYQDKVVEIAKEAITRAGERSVVFALLAGRRRTMTVMASMVAQFFARPCDRLMDLRVEPRGADVPGCFFFPEQRDGRAFEVNGNFVLPSDVEVSLVDVRFPRLRTLLFSEEEPQSYRELLQLGEDACDSAAYPLSLEVRLVNDKKKRGAFLYDPKEQQTACIFRSDAQLLYLASLIEGRELHKDGFVPVGNVQSEDTPFARLVHSIPWAKDCSTQSINSFFTTLKTEADVATANQSLEQMRAKTRKALDEVAETGEARYRKLKLTRKKDEDGKSLWRLPLRDAKVVK